MNVKSSRAIIGISLSASLFLVVGPRAAQAQAGGCSLTALSLYTGISAISAAGNPTPKFSGISPKSALVGGAGATIRLTGSKFVSGSVALWNGSALTTTYVSASKLSAAVPPGDLTAAGKYSVTVVNPGPGGGSSKAETFTVDNGDPTVTGLSADLQTHTAAIDAISADGAKLYVSRNKDAAGHDHRRRDELRLRIGREVEGERRTDDLYVPDGADGDGPGERPDEAGSVQHRRR